MSQPGRDPRGTTPRCPRVPEKPKQGVCLRLSSEEEPGWANVEVIGRRKGGEPWKDVCLTHNLASADVMEEEGYMRMEGRQGLVPALP